MSPPTSRRSAGRFASGWNTMWSSGAMTGFAADLQRAARARKGHALYAPEPDGPDAYVITVESVYRRPERTSGLPSRAVRRHLAHHRRRARARSHSPAQVRRAGGLPAPPGCARTDAGGRPTPESQKIREHPGEVHDSNSEHSHEETRTVCIIGFLLLTSIGRSPVRAWENPPASEIPGSEPVRGPPAARGRR